jgi:hypothetical protein
MPSFEMVSSAFKGEFQANASPARLVLTSTGATPTLEDQVRLFEFLTRVVQSQIKFVAVYDLRVVGMPSPSLLRSLGEWCKRNEKEFQPLNLAIAIVLKNNLWSGAVKKLIGVVTTMCPPVCPLQITYDLESAESFFLEHCGTQKVEATERIPSRFPSTQSCDIDCEEGSWPQAPWSMPELHLLTQKFSFSARPGECWISAGTSLVEDHSMTTTVMKMKNCPMEKDDCSTFADSSCSLSLLDFSERSSDLSTVRNCVSYFSGSDSHCLSEFRSSSKATASASPKNKIGCIPRVRKFVTKTR